MRSIVWFRGKDLRIADHAPLRAALEGDELLPLFVLDPYFFAPERARDYPHRMQFLLDGIGSLQKNLEDRGSRLLLVSGKSVDVVPELARAWNADRVLAQRWVEPFARERDRRVSEALGERFELLEGETLHPPGTLRTGAGRPYSVFTPFSRAFRKQIEIGRPLPAPKELPSVARKSERLPTLESLGLTRNDAVIDGGERAARARLKRFVKANADAYHEQRDRMDLAATSRLSADLKFGTLSPRQVWDATAGDDEAARVYTNELIWREFAHSTLFDRPELLEAPFRDDFVGFPWEDDEKGWKAWVEGTTGYPVVDAAARQLLGEGFVHNRARMITASFLTKHLLIDYRRGEAHFMKWLVDGDWAQNNAGWQWSAGCGCDAQPYFRVFNPITQGKKFDPQGDYVRRWVPELAEVPTRHVHSPWEAPEPPADYPPPIVDHAFARQRYLDVATGYLKKSG